MYMDMYMMRHQSVPHTEELHRTILHSIHVFQEPLKFILPIFSRYNVSLGFCQVSEVLYMPHIRISGSLGCIGRLSRIRQKVVIIVMETSMGNIVPGDMKGLRYDFCYEFINL
ncbi:uncharacterized protein BDCG_16641 [Blastomyces dermatitidis ER-3]|uniref:Uncharacterized protein n=2 Tax=Blastomyces TaxID=229219 RepID=A0A179UGW0_BLAGS|nr:uncharacterized protein BDBG_02591 [Blastomyces gilchristii SLH14081]XP_045280241.1 uncharacterized protein BDCG_16641 [Blastomyces dermatitidis ER-3]OAT00514.1 hypothetical protein BDCG_16641 [Blastomyces dermatitidis ER-3]OAT06377.1 hypothetical protein BDBG_02591 [Blastomyces gilchristii SLH14081]